MEFPLYSSSRYCQSFKTIDNTTDILLEVPGFTKNDIKLEIKGNALYISGKSPNNKIIVNEIKEIIYISNINNLKEINYTVENGILNIKFIMQESKIPIKYI